VRIGCYLSFSCGTEKSLRENISRALVSDSLQAEVQFYRITDTQAETLGLRGSPSMLTDGKDIQPADVAGFS
jgi:hypothetical protein